MHHLTSYVINLFNKLISDTSWIHTVLFLPTVCSLLRNKVIRGSDSIPCEDNTFTFQIILAI